MRNPIMATTYETRLARDPRWALSEGSRHFEEDSAVFQALHKLASRLEALGVAYAVVGGMALFHHGLRRFTEDVDVLVTKDGLKTIHEALDGLGYLPPHPRSRNLRDTELGVRIEFLTAGAFPGDGKPKPVAFPDPGPAGFEADGVRYIKLPQLVELKLASGMTNPGRLKDLADVLELIKRRALPADFAHGLNPFVRAKFLELWSHARPRHVGRLRDFDAPTLESMRADGVTWDDSDADPLLTTDDPDVARRYGLVEESEFLADDGDRPPNSTS